MHETFNQPSTLQNPNKRLALDHRRVLELWQLLSLVDSVLIIPDVPQNTCNVPHNILLAFLINLKDLCVLVQNLAREANVDCSFKLVTREHPKFDSCFFD